MAKKLLIMTAFWLLSATQAITGPRDASDFGKTEATPLRAPEQLFMRMRQLNDSISLLSGIATLEQSFEIERAFYEKSVVGRYLLNYLGHYAVFNQECVENLKLLHVKLCQYLAADPALNDAIAVMAVKFSFRLFQLLNQPNLLCQKGGSLLWKLQQHKTALIAGVGAVTTAVPTILLLLPMLKNFFAAKRHERLLKSGDADALAKAWHELNFKLMWQKPQDRDCQQRRRDEIADRLIASNYLPALKQAVAARKTATNAAKNGLIALLTSDIDMQSGSAAERKKILILQITELRSLLSGQTSLSAASHNSLWRALEEKERQAVYPDCNITVRQLSCGTRQRSNRCAFNALANAHYLGKMTKEELADASLQLAKVTNEVADYTKLLRQLLNPKDDETSNTAQAQQIKQEIRAEIAAQQAYLAWCEGEVRARQSARMAQKDERAAAAAYARMHPKPPEPTQHRTSGTDIKELLAINQGRFTDVEAVFRLWQALQATCTPEQRPAWANPAQHNNTVVLTGGGAEAGAIMRNALEAMICRIRQDGPAALLTSNLCPIAVPGLGFDKDKIRNFQGGAAPICVVLGDDTHWVTARLDYDPKNKSLSITCVDSMSTANTFSSYFDRDVRNNLVRLAYAAVNLDLTQPLPLSREIKELLPEWVADFRAKIVQADGTAREVSGGYRALNMSSLLSDENNFVRHMHLVSENGLAEMVGTIAKAIAHEQQRQRVLDANEINGHVRLLQLILALESRLPRLQKKAAALLAEHQPAAATAVPERAETSSTPVEQAMPAARVESAVALETSTTTEPAEMGKSTASATRIDVVL